MTRVKARRNAIGFTVPGEAAVVVQQLIQAVRFAGKVNCGRLVQPLA
jgi:hypothetical protein